MDKEKLVGFAKAVAENRQDVELAKLEKASAEDLLADTAEGKHLQLCTDHLVKEQGILSEMETVLKSAVLEVYEETKEKKPIDKVEVEIFKRLVYESVAALAWCRANAPSLLAVNKKAFEKTAVDMGAPVIVKEEPKCTIAKDLSSYLEPATEPAEVSEGGK